MKHKFIFLIILLVFTLFTIQNRLVAQDSTFAFKLNGHKYNQEEDLMMRAIQEMFIVAMDSIDIQALIDTLAIDNNLIINELNVPESVEVIYEIDESENYDFLTNVILDTLSISATGLECEFEVNIIGAGFVIRGISTYENGKLNIVLSPPDTLKPEISVVGIGHILCPSIATIFKSEMESEIDTLLIRVASMYDSESFGGLIWPETVLPVRSPNLRICDGET